MANGRKPAKNRAWGNELPLLQETEPGVAMSSDIINTAIQYGSEVTVDRLINIMEKAGLNLPLQDAKRGQNQCPYYSHGLELSL
ncbi:hypothetical protein N7447_006282 [Penicillium robsamsonii]|uniref:uncharacterized protein n=1 Tax=Penicillium robsamsonii TaxID=1792511 RepID=UPI0025495F61|nr:uncharacterized protein N7447_006282 [Penicillium robsamsonii]KAJ5823942.1 hypothetical protein N7447_006282 [Penicillium robsamsonii]